MLTSLAVRRSHTGCGCKSTIRCLVVRVLACKPARLARRKAAAAARLALGVTSALRCRRSWLGLSHFWQQLQRTRGCFVMNRARARMFALMVRHRSRAQRRARLFQRIHREFTGNSQGIHKDSCDVLDYFTVNITMSTLDNGAQLTFPSHLPDNTSYQPQPCPQPERQKRMQGGGRWQ
jgi:hypothetical protein